MVKKFFIDRNGKRVYFSVGHLVDVFCIAKDVYKDHADIAKQVLLAHNVTAKDYTDLYTQMFKLGFARAFENADQFDIERPQGLSSGQLRAVENAILAGKQVYINGKRYGAYSGLFAGDLLSPKQSGELVAE